MAMLAPLGGQGCSWQVVAIMRSAVPLVLVLLWARCEGVKLVFWGPPVLWLRSIAGSFSLVGTFFTFSVLSPSEIYTIANTFPIWVALLSWPMLGRFPSMAVWVSILSSILGVALISGAGLQAGNYAALIVVGVSMASAIAMMGLNRLKDIDPRAIVVHFSATALVFSIVSLFVFPIEPARESFALRHLLELLGVGVTATFGQFFLTKAFTTGDPARVSVASLSQFVMVLVLDVLVLGNSLDPTKLWGIPLILGPTLWLMLQRVKPESALVDIEPEPEVEMLSEPACEPELAMCGESVGAKPRGEVLRTPGI
jgi:drug/metabolite transporter (DMT)-like permease